MPDTQCLRRSRGHERVETHFGEEIPGSEIREQEGEDRDSGEQYEAMHEPAYRVPHASHSFLISATS
jgi:hypothetical protein